MTSRQSKGLVIGFVVTASVVMWSGRSARADAVRDWHMGLNLRTELGTHPIRIDGGVKLGDYDFVLVLDPMFWTDGEYDIDGLVTRRLTASGWGVLGGWRTAAIGLADGHQLQHYALLGGVGPLPDLGAARAQWGVEFSTLIVKHGAGLPTDTISFASGRDLGDIFNFVMFVRFEYASEF